MILLTDPLFPSKYAKWRIEEIKAFIDRGDTDILVDKIRNFACVDYEVDYEYMTEYFNLEKYNILIFDPTYNYLNKYNIRIDGTKFNNVSNYSYIFTTLDHFNIEEYEKIYHIFLSSYNRFTQEYDVPSCKQFIHLYPSGGYSTTEELKYLPKDLNIVCTQSFVTNDVVEVGFNNYINAYGSTLLPKNHSITPKIKNDSKLTVCFSNMGDSKIKGIDFFNNIIKDYCKSFGNSVNFVFVGARYGVPHNELPITYMEPMSQFDLDKFYHDHVDILINGDTGGMLNGWPLGAEAALQGVVLITTDVHNANSWFKYTDDMLFIETNVSTISNIIRRLDMDRDRLLEMSNNIQQHSIQIFSYVNQQQKIFNFLDR